jgi:pyruvoyl-dependent arginine decarboxylase (PvlArgDC)
MGTPTITYDGTSGGISAEVTCVGEKLRFITGKFTFSNSYATGGESLDLGTMLNGAQLKGIKFDDKAGYAFEYDYTNKKVKAFTLAHTHTENTAAAYTQNATTASTTPNTEVSAATDLSSIVLQFFAWGV